MDFELYEYVGCNEAVPKDENFYLIEFIDELPVLCGKKSGRYFIVFEGWEDDWAYLNPECFTEAYK